MTNPLDGLSPLVNPNDVILNKSISLTLVHIVTNLITKIVVFSRVLRPTDATRRKLRVSRNYFNLHQEYDNTMHCTNGQFCLLRNSHPYD